MFLQDNIKGKKESSCSKLYILLIVLSFILIIGISTGLAEVKWDIPVQWDKDAPSHINFDPYPVYRYNDIYNWALGPDVRLAPIDRTDDRRPADGVILEDRAVMEFDLSNILGLHPNGIDTAVLRLNVWSLENVASARILVRGYDGDGLISTDDFGSIKGFSPEPDLGFSFNPVPLSDLGSIVVASTGEISIDITVS